MYLEDEKEEYAWFYGYSNHKPLKVVRDMLHVKMRDTTFTCKWIHVSDIFLAETRVETIHLASSVMVVDGEKDEQDQDNGDAELSPCVVLCVEQSLVGKLSAMLG